jgi:microcystin-dependent protein
MPTEVQIYSNKTIIAEDLADSSITSVKLDPATASNGKGKRTVSTSSPSNAEGNDGDIWYIGESAATNTIIAAMEIPDKSITVAKLTDEASLYLSFPIGGVVMWSGTIAQMPKGWYLCDGGTYGGIKTPDLRNKFIVGSAADGTGTATTPIAGPGFDASPNGGGARTRNYTTHDFGGEDAHKLTIAELASHVHTKGHDVTNSNGVRGGNSDAVVTQVNTGSAGSDNYHENRPPYYALAYIMKCEFRESSQVTITTTQPTLQELRLNGPLYDQEMDGGAQKGNAGDVLTSLGNGNGVRWSAGVPVGSVFHFAASTAPTGYLKANGNPIPNGYGTVQGITANFSALYEILGNTYGLYGDGEQVFRLLPDLRGQFIRSWSDDGTTYDAGRSFGQTQADDFKSHQHYIYGQDNLAAPSGAASNEVANVENPGSGSAHFSRTSSATGGTETRPRNIALLACIKY